jgi:EpsI family protein
MLFGALALHFGFGQVPVAKPQYVPVERFPARVGDWKQTAVLPIPDAVRQKLATAHIVDRIYRDSRGRSVELMLLTATRRDDMHDPARCLPSQGWDITDRTTVKVGSVGATRLTIRQNDSLADAYYWTTGYYAPAGSSSPLDNLLLRVRAHVVSRQQCMSLFVRLMAVDDPANDGALDDFATAIAPQLDAIEAGGLQPGQSVQLSTGVVRRRA